MSRNGGGEGEGERTGTGVVVVVVGGIPGDPVRVGTKTE